MQLEGTGATPDIYHEQLLKLSEEIQQLKNKTTPQLQLLKSYADLPPVNDLQTLFFRISPRKLQPSIRLCSLTHTHTHNVTNTSHLPMYVPPLSCTVIHFNLFILFL